MNRSTSGRLAILLAACVAGSSVAAEDTAKPASPAGAPATRKVPSDAGLSVSTDWFDGLACSMKDARAFYFQVGEAIFQAPPRGVTAATLKHVANLSQTPDRKLVGEIPNSAGCKISPLGLVKVELDGDSGLPKHVYLFEIAPRSGPKSELAKYLDS